MAGRLGSLAPIVLSALAAVDSVLPYAKVLFVLLEFLYRKQGINCPAAGVRSQDEVSMYAKITRSRRAGLLWVVCPTKGESIWLFAVGHPVS